MVMESVLLRVLEVSAASAVVILAVVLLSSLINRSFTAKWKYWFWMVLAVRLLVPFNPSFEAVPAKVEVNIPYNPTITIPAPATAPAPSFQPTDPAAATPISGPVTSWRIVDMMELLVFVWLCGVVLFLLWQLVSYLRFRRQVERWGLPLERDSAAAIVRRQVKAEFGIRGMIPTLICDQVSSPMMIGFFCPLLILPHEEYSAQELTYILRHELTHYKRRDIWYKALLLLANAVHWFNPAVWLMVREASRDLEISCDAAVMKNADMEERRQYSETILACVHREVGVRTALSTHFYGGKKALKERFANILSTKKRRAGVVAFGLVVLCGALAGGVVAFGTVNGSPPVYWARAALSELLTCTVDDAEKYYPIAVPTTLSVEDTDIAPAPELMDEFILHMWGYTMTEDCIQTLIADGVFTRIADFVLESGREVRFDTAELRERADGENLYDFTALQTFETLDGEVVARPTGTIQMVKEDGRWKASHITVTIDFQEPSPAPEAEPLGTSDFLVARGSNESTVVPSQAGIPNESDWAGEAQVREYQEILNNLDPDRVSRFVMYSEPSDHPRQAALTRDQMAEFIGRLKSIYLDTVEPVAPYSGGTTSLHIVTDDDQLTIRHYGNILIIARRDQDMAWIFDGLSCADRIIAMGEMMSGLLENAPEQPETPLYFGLGRGGEAQAMRAGDTIGGWRLESYDAVWDEAYDGGVQVYDAAFTAETPVELTCEVMRSGFSREQYWFYPAEEDWGKLPMLEGTDGTVWFASKNDAALGALEALGDGGERWSCRVALDQYNVSHLPAEVFDMANIVRLELDRELADQSFQTADFNTAILDMDGNSLGSYPEFSIQLPNSWTVSGGSIYDEEGLLTAEILPWIYSTDDSDFDRLAQRYPGEEPADARIGDLEGKRYYQSNTEMVYYLRRNDYLVGLKFYAKYGAGGIGTQREAFENRIRFVG